MNRLTDNVRVHYHIASSMVVCINDSAHEGISVDVRKDSVFIEIDDGEERCLSFEMCMDDAKAFFSAVHNIVAPASGEM